MDDEQREAQIAHERKSGIHNTSPATCSACGNLVTVGMKEKCPHEKTDQKSVVYPLGAD